MLNKVIENYCIQQVGIQYADIIISKSDFIAAVKELNALGYCLAEICWWKRNETDKVIDSFSMGGPIDKRNEKYFFGETNFSRNFEERSLTKNLKQVLSCYSEFVKTDKFDLYPSITLDIAYKK